MIVTILGIVDEITLGIDFETYIGLLDGSFDGSNGDKTEGLFL